MTTAAAPAKTNTPPAGPPLDSNSASVNISLAMIVPSKTNPGRAFNAERDSEMVESIKVHGVLEPILVRAVQDGRLTGHYEIVAGERRYHCAMKAGRASIPAVVRVLTDAQALELQTIENDQREDLDPLAKAAAYYRLFAQYRRDGMEPKAAKALMVQRLGRELRTVEQMVALDKLSPEPRKAMESGLVSLSHAYEICRRPPSTQKMIVKWLDEETYDNDGRLEGPSVRELKAFIREECDHFLSTAQFDQTSKTLLPGAGACTDCPKNSAVNASLVEVDESKDRQKLKAMCTDAECWQQKAKNHLVQIEAAAKKSGKDVTHVSSYSHNPPKGGKPEGTWKEVKPESCQYATTGLVMDGNDEGRILTVCAANNLCKTHWGKGSPASSSYSRPASRPLSDAEKKKRLTEQRGKKLDQAYRSAATVALRKGITSLSIDDLRDIALVTCKMMDRRLRCGLFAAMGWGDGGKSFYGPPVPTAKIAALKPADAAAFLSLIVMGNSILPDVEGYWGTDQRAKPELFAKRHKVNLAAIRKTAEDPLREKFAEIDARKKKAAPAQTSAAKKGAKR